MNKENMNRLIDHLKKINSRNFAMHHWICAAHFSTAIHNYDGKPAKNLVSTMEEGKAECGTVACIAGHAAILSDSENNNNFDLNNAYLAPYRARRWLGLSEEQSDALFMPEQDRYWHSGLRKVIAVLEHLRDTGKVNWKVSIRKPLDPQAMA